MPVILASTIRELHAALADRQPAFVPTMGALHAGHESLIRRAREIAGPDGLVAVSIFVNPTQFAPHEDFARYPRQLKQDIALIERAGGDIVFAPSVNEMYPAGLERVADDFSMPPLPNVATQPQLEDASRPGHFLGVCKVVARLFDIVRPAQAIFGEKDYQQLRVISEMVAQQNSTARTRAPGDNPVHRAKTSRESRARWPNLEIIPHPTIREKDGLALSSRNAYLKPEERQRAGSLWRALNAARSARPQAAELSMRDVLEAHDLKVDYAAVRDAETLLPPADEAHRLRALIAARLGSVRLIDNMMLVQKGAAV